VDNKGRTIVLGVVLGAGIGLVTAMMLNRRAENEGRTTAITAGEGLQLGALVVGLLRTIATLGDTERE
jgi:predicted membrane-bound spermidine synthase